MSLDIFLTNNLTNKKEKFIPQDKNNVRMYVCGPTVYDDPHIGNARPLVVFDVLYRVLKILYGSNVIYVRNITDVDDKIIDASLKKKISIEEITSKVTKIFHDNCKSLNCLKPSVEPKATEHIEGMIEISNLMVIPPNSILTFQIMIILRGKLPEEIIIMHQN